MSIVFCFESFGHTATILLKRLHEKELTSNPIVLNFHGPDALSMSLLKIAGTSADKKRT